MGSKVLLGLSGGVDSAVAAYFLKRDGYEVTGCFMRNWDSIANNDIKGNPTLSGSKCSQELDYDDAKKTAEELGIPLLREDFVKEYWDDVFSYFLSEYKEGRTPNPDVFCNKYIKFEAFRKFAHANGFPLIAMGHYAKRVDQDGYAMLYKAFDKNKDQSYFLAEINEEQLKESLFPLSDITKPEVRKIAKGLGLSVASKRDSTGVCFIGERRFKPFLENYLPAHQGDVVDIVTGKKIAKHDGVLFYTVGQHRGLNIGGIKGYKDEPWFVVGKDVKQNILYVGQEDNPFMYSYKCRLCKVNLLLKDIPTQPLDICAKFRYRGRDMKVKFTYISPEEAYLEYPGYKYIAKGQIAVLYEGERCLGGGIIKETYDKNGKTIAY
ncbi:MAG: tRNA 2-thiouridine(34) synthase MnmA [Bacilli bacterium]|jgi:tRNA-specific 2-thiouridylase|nr:tRNA 2-thiouridine(34) synthase MnmA [Bacilli bacterium]